MTTHKEALVAARDASYGVTAYGMADMEAAIRAYLDARGMVMVPNTLEGAEVLIDLVRSYTITPWALWEDLVEQYKDPFKE